MRRTSDPRAAVYRRALAAAGSDWRAGSRICGRRRRRPTRRTSRPWSSPSVAKPSTSSPRRWRSPTTRTIPTIRVRRQRASGRRRATPAAARRAAARAADAGTGLLPLRRLVRGCVRATGLVCRHVAVARCRMVGLAASDFRPRQRWELAAVVETHRACAEARREVAARRDVAGPSAGADDDLDAAACRCAQPRSKVAAASSRRFGQDPRGQAGHRVDGRRARGGPARARGSSATTRGRERGQDTDPQPAALIARQSVSTPQPSASSSATAPRGWRRPDAAIEIGHLPRQAAPCSQGHDLAPDWPTADRRALDAGRLCAVVAALRIHVATTPEARHPLRVREPPPDALSAVPRQGPVRLVGRRRGRVQADRRPAQARRHALDRRRGQRLIALRCCILSGRFEDFWERRSQTPPEEASHSDVVHPPARIIILCCGIAIGSW